MTKKTANLTVEKPKRARITLECSLEQRKAIRIMAAQADQSMNEFILSVVEEKKRKMPNLERSLV